MSLLKSFRASAAGALLPALGACVLLLPGLAAAQVSVDEDFTGTSSKNSWFFYNGACLTAGTDVNTTSPNKIPGCKKVLKTYYNTTGSDHDTAMVGGYLGYLGSAGAPGSLDNQVADPDQHGALRFTNGAPYGHNESGAVVSNFTMGTGDGLEITFKTITYAGNKAQNGSNGNSSPWSLQQGADGISFYLLDGCMPLVGGTVPDGCPQDDGSGSAQSQRAAKVYGSKATGYNQYPGIGAFGGSLAYSCSNSNNPHDGLVGGYLGLGVDEWGNFLNGTSNTIDPGNGTDNTHLGDNTATGGGQYSNRIGLRGAGNISWASLTNAYGSNPNDAGSPYYPASLDTSCATGTYDLYNKSCGSCSSGNYIAGDASTPGYCSTCPANGSGFNAATVQCAVCPTNTNYESGGAHAGQCGSCAAGYTWNAGSGGTCKKTNNPNKGTAGIVTWVAQTTQVPPNSGSASFNTNNLYSHRAVQNTCSTGNLWNYSTAGTPTAAGAADLSNAKNTAGIMDYAAIAGGFSVIDPTKLLIANDNATKRDDGTALFYDVKLTKNGNLTFSYSKNGSAYKTVLKDQPITSSNGPLPNLFRFGFAASTGGATNIHEIMCFKASPAKEAGGSTSVNTKQSSKIQSTTQAYFGFYNPTPTVWSGNVTANKLDVDDSGVVSVETTPQWDAGCLLTGGACLTNKSVAAMSAASRVMLSYDGSQGVPFKWDNLGSDQQNALVNADRVNYLRGDRSNEIPNGANLFRTRDAILSDIIDSSPVWVGPPISPFTGGWVDRLRSADTPAETTGQSYVKFVQDEQSRLNVVYVGSNDGFVHGFRSGSFDSSNTFQTGGSTPNDGQEVLAYMPKAVSLVIHNAGSDDDSTAADFTGTHYGHAFYVDATPTTGDLFYNKAWHTWLVGGLGAGGAAIFALDITDPLGTASGTASFAEGNARNLVIGEWNPSTLSCDNSQGGSGCGASLGNTYGTPLIRRLHNGHWAVIFGNGLGSSSSDAGIYVLSVDQTDPSKSVFYYLSTGYAAAQVAAGKTPAANGISYTTSADLDGDHITDYVYAGDLLGNVWRFDLTDTDPAKWGVRTAPVFTAPAGQPITSQIVVASVPVTGDSPRIMLAFGTGQRTQLTNDTPTTFVTGQQSLYGVWDWDMSAWNGLSSVKYAVDATQTAGSGTIAAASLGTQTFSCTTTVCDGTNNTICWQNSTICTTSPNTQLGWTVQLPGGAAATGYEQVIFNPTLFNGVFLLNSTVPGNNTPTNCQPTLDGGVTYAVSVASGGTVQTSGSDGIFPQYHDTAAVGVVLNATGTPQVVNTPVGTSALVYQTVGGTPGSTQFNPPPNTRANRLTWIELR